MMNHRSVGTYYWTTEPNFGDLLTPLLGRHFASLDVHWAPPAAAELVITGSVLDSLPNGWDGIIAGAGKLHEDARLRLNPRAVLGVRGKLTAREFPGDPVIGDPALLVDELVSVEQEFDLGIVPHWTDTSLVPRFRYLTRDFSVRIIPANLPPLDVVRFIGGCRKIVSSSLHGIVVADAFGIPRRAERFPRMGTSPYEGGEFKFHDYASGIGLPMEFGKLQQPPREHIEAMQADLFDMLKTLSKRYT